MGGLALLLSKGPPSKGEEPSDKEMDKESPEEDDKEAALEDEYLSDAFAAVKSDDKDGFMEAMKSAVKACMDTDYSK